MHPFVNGTGATTTAYVIRSSATHRRQVPVLTGTPIARLHMRPPSIRSGLPGMTRPSCHLHRRASSSCLQSSALPQRQLPRQKGVRMPRTRPTLPVHQELRQWQSPRKMHGFWTFHFYSSLTVSFFDLRPRK
uniref:Uncharacterized protein n=1 Tax=Rhipicephalus appendiculatus TaxID=34631 RepID=A0A131YG15_RHIAP